MSALKGPVSAYLGGKEGTGDIAAVVFSCCLREISQAQVCAREGIICPGSRLILWRQRGPGRPVVNVCETLSTREQTLNVFCTSCGVLVYDSACT